MPIQLDDGTTLPVRLLPATGPHRHPVHLDNPRPVVVVAPGLGIPAGYYEPFGEDLATRGFDVAITELRGQGDSRPRPSSASRYGYHEMVAVDFPAVFSVVRDRFPASTPYLLGHSMGGQLGALYAGRIRGRLGGLILVASGTPYHRGFGGVRAPALLLGSAAMSITANVAGFWPGDRVDVGGFGRQSKVLISDWSRLARTGRFDPEGADTDYEDRLARLTLPVLSIIDHRRRPRPGEFGRAPARETGEGADHDVAPARTARPQRLDPQPCHHRRPDRGLAPRPLTREWLWSPETP